MLLVSCFVNNRLVVRLNQKEGQAGFRLRRSCIDNVFTLNEIIQGRLREGTLMIFLRCSKSIGYCLA